MENIIKECCSIIEKPNDFLITELNGEISFDYSNTNIKFKYQLGDNNFMEINPISFPLAYHVWRIVKGKLFLDDKDNKFEINFIFDIFTEIIKIFTNGFYKYCTVCGKDQLSFNDISYCNDSACFDNYCHLATSNYIIDNYKRDPLAILFLIKTVKECIKSPKCNTVFDPFPKRYEKDGVKKFDELYKILKDENNKIYIDIINCNSDQILFDKLGENMYGLIKFIILTNKTNIRSEKILSNNKIFDDNINLEINLDINKDTKFINFQVIHNSKIEEKFKTNKPEYLFHGSAIGNWYSIMRNGLKNYSNTKMMQNGAAYGPGIYLSDKITCSSHYSSQGSQNKLKIIGVVQILNKEKYKKTSSIYVVDDEEKIILRYLILTNNCYLEDIQKYIMVERTSEIELYNKNNNFILMKRLRQEIKNIEILPKKYPQLNKLKININNMRISISFDNNYEIEIIIPDSYPGDPPFVRIVKPIISFNNFINDAGVIRLPELSINKWNSRVKLADIVIKIFELLKISNEDKNRKGKKNKKKKEYNYDKAYENYCNNLLL